MNDKSTSGKTPEETKAEKVKRVDVKLTEPHTHKGEDKAPGDTINVTESQAKRLFEAKRAVPAQ